jgi:predicted RNase H-like HicB family nuclease
MFVAQCLDVDVASQGASAEQALANLREAVELFLETASAEEVRELAMGTLLAIIRRSGVVRSAFEV